MTFAAGLILGFVGASALFVGTLLLAVYATHKGSSRDDTTDNTIGKVSASQRPASGNDPLPRG